ncbi:hypothetical protein HK405_011870 [Cladochytrium tenue]|nr:hypothetical protein HK405_011870 [Cladochytrium tenue]
MTTTEADDATTLRQRHAAKAADDCDDSAAAPQTNSDLTTNSEEAKRPLRILMATEYLPPYVSGIANRCKNLIKGYRDNGHHVTVAGPVGTNADIIVPSVPNIFYEHQRVFILPPLALLVQLLNFQRSVPYDIVHIVGPLCLSFLLLLPLFKLRGVKIYVSYHVYLEYYKHLYLGDNKILGMFGEGLYIIFYFIPLVWFADVVGIPSKTADWVVFKYSKQIHYMKSGLNTEVFAPLPGSLGPDDDSIDSQPLPQIPSLAEGDVLLSSPPLVEASTANPVLVYIGRLAVEKNIEFLISAMADPFLLQASLVLVGDGPSRAALETLAAETVGADAVFSYRPADAEDKSAEAAAPDATEKAAASATSDRPWGLGGDGTVDGRRYRVLFVGMVRDEREVASGYYARADAFVSASASETFGFTVAEAMACGTPAVVVRSGAFASVYRAIDGWMFVPGRADDYVARLRRVLADGRAARRAARQVAVQGFGVDSAVRDLLQTYEWCVNADGKSQKRIGL